ncbi:MAG: flagellar hook-basal body complex protein FliE [Spirochaetota bacterium]
MIIENMVSGNIVTMKATNPLHFTGEPLMRRPGDDVSGSFADVLNNAIAKVNDLQIDSENMMQKMIYAPESVDIHQVMIATQKAEIAVSLTKAVRDGAINAYKELINLR